MSRGRPLAALLAALALAAPGSALAQSAGDEQYQDPFAQEDQGGSQQQGSGSQGGGEAQAPSAAPTPSTAPAETSAAPATAAQTGTLPRTGMATPLPLAYGFVLLLAGSALRRAARRTA